MATPDVEVQSALNGEQSTGGYRPWAFVHVRARTVFGSLSRLQPFNRQINGKTVATTPSALDQVIGTAEQTAWRYVASDGHVYDLKDTVLLLLESLLEAGPDRVAELKAKVSTLRPWPADYPGAPDYEK